MHLCKTSLPLQRAMHNVAWATGVAIDRLLGERGNGLVKEIAEFVDACRVRLELDHSLMVAAMMFAQPLIFKLPKEQPVWKIAYIAGLCIGVKLTTEGAPPSRSLPSRVFPHPRWCRHNRFPYGGHPQCDGRV